MGGDTEKIIIQVLTKNKSRCISYVTELSLYNSSVYYPWELCPEDVDKQMNTKLDNNRTSVFNTLTNNGSFQAIYESENQYYIRAAYITPTIVEKTVFDTLSNKVTTLENKCSSLETQYNTLSNKYNNLETQYNTLSDKYNDLEKRIANLEKPSEPQN